MCLASMIAWQRARPEWSSLWLATACTSLTVLSMSDKQAIQIKLQVVRNPLIEVKICFLPIRRWRDPTDGLCYSKHLLKFLISSVSEHNFYKDPKSGKSLHTWVSTGKSSFWRWNIRRQATCHDTNIIYLNMSKNSEDQMRSKLMVACLNKKFWVKFIYNPLTLKL